MPRSANLGNGQLLITLDDKALMRDIYYPYVGMEDQTDYKHFHRVGIYDEDKKQMSWLNEDDWRSEMKYEGDSLVCISVLKNEKIGLTLRFRDGVHMQENIFIRSIDIINDRDSNRTIKIFFNQDIHLYGGKRQDTALFDPQMRNPIKDGAIIHYRKRRYCLINGYSPEAGIEEFSIGKSHYRHLEGTWRDAEDGKLDGNAIEQGSVDSTIGFIHHLAPKKSSKQYYWFCIGKTHHEIENLNQIVIDNTPEHLLDTTKQYWTNWSNQKRLGCIQQDKKTLHLLRLSLLLIRSQIDRGGAIIAANDSDIMAFNKDTYTYMWPRDGALVAHAMDTAGYFEITRKFFEFCARVITKEGFMLHKYNPDGSVGSSWHPWYRDGKRILPIQEDETALVLYALDHHYQTFQDMEFIRPIYHDFIKPASEFLESFINNPTGLPNPTYDLWEEHLGIHTWTTASTIAGLKAAHNLAKLMGHPESAERYMSRANALTKALKQHLWNEEEQCFYKFVKVDGQGNIVERNSTIDASSLGVGLFGVLDPDDAMVIKNNQKVKETLWVPTEVGGFARYQNDRYQRTEGGPEIPGNPWIITTLWYAMWLTDLAKKPEELKEAAELIHWVTDKASSTGILPEQLDFATGAHVSVSPLTWSHATYVEAVLKYSHKLEEFGICEYAPPDKH